MTSTLNTAPQLHAALMAAAATAPEKRSTTAPHHLIFRMVRLADGGRPMFKILNTTEGLTRFALKVAAKPALFGGGVVNERKARKAPAQWSAPTLKLIRELIEDHDYTGALELADEKAGPLFYTNSEGLTYMLTGPSNIESLPGLQSAQHESGHYVVIEPISGFSAVSTLQKVRSRTTAEADAEKHIKFSGRALSELIQQAQATPQDQETARAIWMTQHGLTVDQSTLDRIEARKAENEAQSLAQYEATQAQAAQDLARITAEFEASKAAQAVADLVATATACAAIEATETAPELATCETEHHATEATQEHTQQHNACTNATPPARLAGLVTQQRGQILASKTGAWRAVFFTGDDGAPSLQFNTDGKNPPTLQSFATPRERMAALQAMAAQADRAHRTQNPSSRTDTPQATAPTAPDYTTPRETSEGALSITLTRAEGPSSECGQPVTVASFEAADKVLRAWSETAPAKGGYDKCDFLITWADGGTYDGRYDLKHHSAEPASLTAHMIDQAEFFTGKFCPAHMSREKYSGLMTETDPATKTVYAEILATMAAMGVYYPKARPEALDLRAMMAEGIAPSALVGLGVNYNGNMTDPEGVGAITQASACKWYGLAIVVQLEDGREISANPHSFGHEFKDYFYLNFKQHGTPYLAQLAAAVASKKAAKTSAEAIAKQAHAAELARLAAEFPQLKRAENTHTGGKLAAVNIRTLLKAKFKGIKFSVTSDYNSVRVNWTDGPTQSQVEEITNRFDIGASDTQTDYFYTVATAWSDLFGGVQYMNMRRDMSDAAIIEILAQAWPEGNGDPRPSLQDWRKQTGLFDRYTQGDHWTLKMRNAITHWTPAGKV